MKNAEQQWCAALMELFRPIDRPLIRDVIAAGKRLGSPTARVAVLECLKSGLVDLVSQSRGVSPPRPPEPEEDIESRVRRDTALAAAVVFSQEIDAMGVLEMIEFADKVMAESVREKLPCARCGLLMDGIGHGRSECAVGYGADDAGGRGGDAPRGRSTPDE